MTIVAGTGHRPSKLGGYSKQVREGLIELAESQLLLIEPDIVISGGALGWDQALAEAAYVLDIPYHMYLPFEGFNYKWPKESRRVFADICHYAAYVTYVSEPGYHPAKLQIRNEIMVDSADMMLALWDGSTGGTANCIKYAEKKGVPVHNCWHLYNLPGKTK